MDYQTYKNREKQVEAVKFENLEDIGELVQTLFDVGCEYINVKDVPLNPQLEDTSYITTIAFKQNDTIQVLFLGDILSFDMEDNAIVWNEEDFLDEFELIGVEMLDNILSFIFGAFIFFFVGAIVEEVTSKTKIVESQTQYIEQGYIKAFTDQMGYDIGVPVAKCKLSGGEPVVSGNRVACVKEMKDD